VLVGEAEAFAAILAATAGFASLGEAADIFAPDRLGPASGAGFGAEDGDRGVVVTVAIHLSIASGRA
jgi:hypothetical protein